MVQKVDKIYYLDEIKKIMRKPICIRFIKYHIESKKTRYINFEPITNYVNINEISNQIPYDKEFLLNNLEIIIKKSIEFGFIKKKISYVENKRTDEFIDLSKIQNGIIEYLKKTSNLKLRPQPDKIYITYKVLIKKIISCLMDLKYFRYLIENFYSYNFKLMFKIVQKSKFDSIQNKTEIIQLLSLVKRRTPKYIVEIGTARGGTFYMLTRVATNDATLVSIDIGYENKQRFYSFAKKNQKIILIEENSNSKFAIEKVKKIFTEGIDFLLIDGNHKYDAIKNDFYNYSPLVKPGGIIAFHDIIESNLKRFGIYTGRNCGGVPKFWQEIKNNYKYNEFTTYKNQDALGIGVIIYFPQDTRKI